MVNVLEVNGKIIITIFYVYCEINAVQVQLASWASEPVTPVEPASPTLPKTEKIDKLEFWEPNPEFNARRSEISKISKTSTTPTKAVKPRFRNDNEEPAKYTKGFRAEIRHSAPKHVLRHGQSHLEPIPKDSNGNTDTDTDNSEDKNYNSNKNHNVNKDKNQSKDKKHYTDRDHNKDTNNDKKHNIDKNHNMGRNHYINKNNNMGDSHNVDKNHNINKNHNKDKNNMDSKNKVGMRHDKSHNNMNKNQNTDESDEMDNNQSKNKFSHQDKKHIKQKDIHIRIPQLQPEPVRGQIMESHWPAHEHRSKLRTHKVQKPDDDIYIRSTRMTPMYLMQQPGEDDGQKPKKVMPENAAVSLSPYSLTQQMKDMFEEFTEANATFETIGRTVEYNDIVLIKINEKKSEDGKYFRAEESKYIDEVPEKKIIFIVHGLSVMGMSKLASLNNANQMKVLLSYYLKHLDKFDIFLMPMANPDGYSAAHTISLWNKNVSPQDACPGVALDRNFDVAWNATRVISSCSQLFPGPAPFSETETKAVRDVFHYHGHKILAYIHVHAGTYSDSIFKGDAILYPRGFTESQSDDDKYIDLKGEIDEAMKNASFQVMSVTVDTVHNWYGKVAGSSVDYASTVYGIPYALEFVMQLYMDGGGGSHETYEYYALTEIWARLIDTTFNNMWKSLHVTNEVKKK